MLTVGAQAISGSIISGEANAKWQSYKFSYGSFGNPTAIYVSGSDKNTPGNIDGDMRLVWYQYEDGVNNGRVRRMNYGNGAYVDYTYDLFDRVIKEAYNDGTEYHYFYDTEGNLSRQCCVENGSVTEVYVFEYDSLGRLIRSKQTSDGTLQDGTVDEGTTVQRTEHLYDNENRITSQSWQLGTRTYSESYTYNDDVSTNTGSIKDGSPATMTISPLGKTLSFTYDSLKHLSKVTVPGIYTRQYSYRGLTSTRSTNQISRVSYTLGSNTTAGLYYDYTYDSAGNITQIKQNGTQIAAYEYDEQGQLLEETRDGVTYRYTYDTAGNILDVTVSGIYSSYKAFTYGNDTWKDLLTTIKIGSTSQSISYDASGNPTNWYNGNTLTNLTWSKGRQLTNLNKGTTAISYTYDMSGIRSSKTVDGATYNYITQNGQVVRQTWGSNILDIVYDNNSQPFALCYSNNNGESFTTFYYVLNAQGEVVRLVNSSGTTYASYEYDAWGKIVDQQSYNSNFPYLHIVNPIRYRGYYYDTETGFYYVSSRYYDPEIGRWINADTTDVLTATPMGLTDKNLFAYCDNNPVMRADYGGDFWHIVVGAAAGALIGGVVKAVSNAIEGKSLTDGLATAMLAGAASGALASTGVGIVGMVAGNAAISMAENAANQVIENKGFNNFDVGDMLIDGAIGGVSGALGGAGKGTKHLTNLGKQTVKRTFNATTHKGLKAGLKEAGKAFAYYGKNSAKYYKTFVKGLPSDFISTVGTTIASSNYMKYQYRRIFGR